MAATVIVHGGQAPRFDPSVCPSTGTRKRNLCLSIRADYMRGIDEWLNYMEGSRAPVSLNEWIPWGDECLKCLVQNASGRTSRTHKQVCSLWSRDPLSWASLASG